MSTLHAAMRRPGNHGLVAGIINKMAALENIRVFRRFVIDENNSYKDRLGEIKNHYPNLCDCILRS